jgi:GntR family transcriptional regulator, gluconate operon transcriptional repressor
LASGASERTPSRLTELRTPTLAEEAARLIRESIIAGEFQHGERLVEAALAERLGVSRGTIRQALRRVGADGLVREEPRRGVFVVRLTSEDLQEIYELRAALEARAVRLLIAARSEPSAPSLAGLTQILHQMELAASRGDSHVLAEADLEFHQAICTLSGNSRLLRVFATESSMLQTLMEVEVARYRTFYRSLDEIVDEHREILAAIEQGDAPRAEALVDDHLARSSEHSLQVASGSIEPGTAAFGGGQ